MQPEGRSAWLPSNLKLKRPSGKGVRFPGLKERVFISWLPAVFLVALYRSLKNTALVLKLWAATTRGRASLTLSMLWGQRYMYFDMGVSSVNLKSLYVCQTLLALPRLLSSSSFVSKPASSDSVLNTICPLVQVACDPFLPNEISREVC